MTIETISPRQLAERCPAGSSFDLIDVRTPVEFREVHVDGARNVPLSTLDPALLIQNRRAAVSEPIYLLCRSGGRGQQACQKLIQAGFPHVVNVEGGTLACIEAGLPVVRGAPAVSLERQVRIVAGALVLLGTTLGWLVHPAWSGLSAFVGAGLLVAGLTDTCAMGLLLARMPWNQLPQKAASCNAR